MLKKCDFFKPYESITTISKDNKNKKPTCNLNSLGFRGEELNINAKKRIYVSGCSLTFGHGLNDEDIWVSQFKRLLINKYDLLPDDINLLNFGMGGSSNDYISRILISQSERLKPDLLIAYFSYINRVEYINENTTLRLGVWSFNSSSIAFNDALSYYGYYNDYIGFINMIKNILLLQYYCKSKNIPSIIGGVDLSLINDRKFLSHNICKDFIDLLDKDNLFIENIFHCGNDKALDNTHTGPEINKEFAKRLFDFYKSRFDSLLILRRNKINSMKKNLNSIRDNLKNNY